MSEDWPDGESGQQAEFEARRIYVRNLSLVTITRGGPFDGGRCIVLGVHLNRGDMQEGVERKLILSPEQTQQLLRFCQTVIEGGYLEDPGDEELESPSS